MRFNTYYLTHIDGTPYLLPYGQAVADKQKAVALNETSRYIWECLQTLPTRDELLGSIFEHFEIEDTDKAAVENDVRDFLIQLKAYHIIEECEYLIDADASTSYENIILPSAAVQKKITIAGININIKCLPQLYHKSFIPFENDFDDETQDIIIQISPYSPIYHRNGTIILRTDELMIMEDDLAYMCRYPNNSGLLGWHMSKDGAECNIFCNGTDYIKSCEDIFHAIRMIYLFTAQSKGLFAIHSVSVLYNKRALLFSGYSGSGKSTHAALWNKLFDTPVLNGDLNLLEVKADTVLAHGIPWCGTSETFTTKSYPVSAIVFLKQEPVNLASELTLEQAQLKIMQRMISPAWFASQVEKNLTAAGRIADLIQAFKMYCTKDDDAAITLKASIDNICGSEE